ncbi:MAG: hypothetical protein LPK38_00295, partial [Actinomycetes bacterium]|nr:hypothetical protein [Actinomycetes bacterium]MDX5379763.1 hypothetical protein [Actinomycetes bacterium]MDX5398170.1 hypothetical protein [Actinomycetes bacterium]MDX5449459.1 hypothetical protein [Actinomycetes bacterium]
MTTADLLDTILSGTPAELDAARAHVLASRGKGDLAQVAAAERAIRMAPDDVLRLADDGGASVVVGERTYAGGRFAARPIGELRAAVTGRSAPTLSVIAGGGPLADIGALQAWAGRGTLFQVASQFNCLESPGPYLVEVADYVHDSTQGPRASISAFPGTLVRHYAAPDGLGGTFTQSGDRQLDLLADALPPEVGRVHAGYLKAHHVDAQRAAEALADRFDAIRVGVHDDVEVVLGADWRGAVAGRPRIAQVFTSTLAAGMYGGGEQVTGALAEVCRQLLRAAYLGTLLAAIDLGRTRVLLTMI